MNVKERVVWIRAWRSCYSGLATGEMAAAAEAVEPGCACRNPLMG